VEPVIWHLKDGHRMGRNDLAGRAGDAVGYNFRLLLVWLAGLLCALRVIGFTKEQDATNALYAG